MSVPKDVREAVAGRLWREADRVGWFNLPDPDRAKLYERWTRDAEIGLRLGHYMDPRQVRVYIKDTLLKSYARRRLLSIEAEVWRVLELPQPPAGKTFIKPHGRILGDGRVVSWGKSRDWKLILCSVHERAWLTNGAPYGAVLVETGATAGTRDRELVISLANRLRVARLEWLD